MLLGTDFNENFMSVCPSVRSSVPLSVFKKSFPRLTWKWYKILLIPMFDTRWLKQNATQISFSSHMHAWELSKELISINLFLILGLIFLLLILSIFLEKKSDFVPVIPLWSCQETFRSMNISCICQHSSGPFNGQQYCAICSSTPISLCEIWCVSLHSNNG